LAALAVLSSLVLGPAPPAQADEQGPKARFDWSMPERFGTEVTVRDLNPPPEVIHPVRLRVRLDARASTAGRSPIQTFKWEIRNADGTLAVDEPPSDSASLLIRVPAGTYPTKLTVTDQDGRSDTVAMDVVVKDLLVVSVGDSVAAGEGNPEIVGVPQSDERWPEWQDQRCHRSPLSGPVQAALQMEKADPHTSVTFLSLACSGAKIAQHPGDPRFKGGLLDPYDGIAPPKGPHEPLPAQIDELARLLCPPGVAPCAPGQLRRIDALLITVGANDLHFGHVVDRCVRDVLGCDGDSSLRDEISRDRRLLPDLYRDLAKAISQKLTVSRVYMTEYFDPTHDAARFCKMDDFADLGSYAQITPGESEWAFNTLIEPLNKQVETSAREHRWNYVGNIASQFLTHGYCARDHWIVQYHESKRDQGDEEGTMHPNGSGQTVYEKRLVMDVFGAFVNGSAIDDGDGSLSSPYKRLASGVSAIPPGGTVWISRGRYSAAGVYSKPMTLQARGGASGPVVLGR
jgi:hypothetical protein